MGKRGPKPKPPEELRSVTRSCRLTLEEAELLEEAAERKGEPVTRWMRKTLLRSARRIVEGRKR